MANAYCVLKLIKHFTCINKLNPYNPTWQVTSIICIFRRGNWGTERVEIHSLYIMELGILAPDLIVYHYIILLCLVYWKSLSIFFLPNWLVEFSLIVLIILQPLLSVHQIVILFVFVVSVVSEPVVSVALKVVRSSEVWVFFLVGKWVKSSEKDLLWCQWNLSFICTGAFQNPGSGPKPMFTLSNVFVNF